ncbi:PilZ domain-containing protein [Methylobacterium sp. C25]|uniref:PilZ domain-containing protein n=1 Tax=Methylobacterium sp. C25 TaxID=2721622 RepID=UPI001F37759C|nr:PilZ domain-containing protein [Methylobacterium sp. C25]MCE4226437.1 PilZ domain-containing protein [Methylobacterium sp. C25]
MSMDQRQNVRMRTFLRGRIVYNGGASSMDCLVRDLSATGARLELSETSPLPEVFDLYIQNKDQTFRSTMRWRRDSGVGVTFDDAATKSAPVQEKPAEAPAASDPAMSILIRRIAELEAENAALRAAITSLGRSPTSSAA